MARSSTGLAIKEDAWRPTPSGPQLTLVPPEPDAASAPTRETNEHLALCLRGFMCATAGQDELAIAMFRRAIEVKPDAVAYCNLGWMLSKRDQHAEAIEAYCQAIRIRPDFSDAYRNLATKCAHLGQLSDARSLYLRAVELKRDDVEAYFGVGWVFLTEGEFESAIKAFQKAIQLKPDFAEAYHNLGSALGQTGEIAESIAAYSKAVHLKPNLAAAYYGLGGALAVNGQFCEAFDAWFNAVELRPDFAEAHCAIGWLLERDGRLTDAITAYRTATERAPDYPEAHFSLGSALWMAGDKQAGARAYLRALELKPDVENREQIEAALAEFLAKERGRTNTEYSVYESNSLSYPDDIMELTEQQLFVVAKSRLSADELQEAIDLYKATKAETTNRGTTGGATDAPRPETPATAAQVSAAAKPSRRKTRHVFTPEELQNPKSVDRALDTLADIEAARRAGSEIPEPLRLEGRRAKALLRKVGRLAT